MPPKKTPAKSKQEPAEENSGEDTTKEEEETVKVNFILCPCSNYELRLAS